MTTTACPGKRRRAYLEHTLQRLLDAAELLVWELDELDGDADLEPCNGSVAVSPYASQKRWAQGVRDDREDCCEDEGADDEREPDPLDLAVEYHPEDQRQVITGRFGDRVFYTEV